MGTLKIEVQPDAPNGMARMILGEYWALDGSPIEEGIVLERSQRVNVEATTTGRAGAIPASSTSSTPRRPHLTLPATGGPAGTALVGVAAAASGLALRSLSREERHEELQDLRS